MSAGRNDVGTANITRLLHDWGDGDTRAFDELLPLIYAELHRRAAIYLRYERRNHTLQPTALVHEAYLKLVDQSNVHWENRMHFFAVAARAMREILIDHAKSRNREKRGGGSEDLPLEEALLAAAEENDVDLIALDEALTRLGEIDPQQVRIVELRYFCGLSLDETAETIGISRATVARDWTMAKAWLHREMTR
jgi:RNA polymerase sigma factor (TIGR02999 family)